MMADSSLHIIQCPHCSIQISIQKNELNCCIFRCGQYKSTGEPINPHMPKDECDRLHNNDLIYGCSRPFRFDGNILSTCGYI